MTDADASGRAALRDAGVADDDATPATLGALAGRSLELDCAIVERLASVIDDAHAVALRDLAAGAEQRGWKRAAKEARRALYRFGQRGVVPPAIPVAPTPPPR